MAKHTITRECGHEDEVELHGPKRTLKKRLDRQRRLTCRACHNEQQTAKVEAAARAPDLPALTGTPRQIAWATDLRYKALSGVGHYLTYVLANNRRRRSSAHEMALFEAKLERALEPLIAQTEAAWWIDRRDVEAITLLESVWTQDLEA